MMHIKKSKPLSPSKLDVLKVCPLRYLLETERTISPRLPASLYAIRGTSIHKAIENNIGRDALSKRDIIDELQEIIRKNILKTKDNKVLYSIYETQGLNAIFSRQQLISMTQFVFESCQRLGKYVTNVSTQRKQNDATQHLGVERELHSLKYDLKGKPDLTYLDELGVCHVVDFKSGQIRSEEGLIKDEYIYQLAAYALIIKELFQYENICLDIISLNDSESILFDAVLERKIINLISGADAIFNMGSSKSIDHLGETGEHCMKCSFRVSCDCYAKKFMEIYETNPKNCSDIHGLLLEITESVSLCRLKVENFDGHIHLITGVPKSMCKELVIGKRFSAYSTKSIETSSYGKPAVNHYVVNQLYPSKSAFNCLIVAS